LPTSTSSYTSDRIGGLFRLTHPFPSLLNALATGAIAILAGGAPVVALRLGAAMFALQASIGSLNDLVDATLDAGHKPGKPIPRGQASPHDARVIVALGLALGLTLTWPSGVAATGVALAGIACGYVYDLRMSRTAWSWLPFAIALPLVPMYAWFGATANAPGALLELIPIGVLAGAGLALANGLADLERDDAGGVQTAAVRLGQHRAWILHAGLLVAAMGFAFIELPRGGASDGSMVGLPGLGLVLGAVLVATGIAIGRDGGPLRRERAWELEAIGVAVVGAGWVAGVAGLA